jgi:hypothetical protein
MNNKNSGSMNTVSTQLPAIFIVQLWGTTLKQTIILVQHSKLVIPNQSILSVLSVKFNPNNQRCNTNLKEKIKIYF